MTHSVFVAAPVTSLPGSAPVSALRYTFPLVPALFFFWGVFFFLFDPFRSPTPRGLLRLFAGFISTNGGVHFSGPCIMGWWGGYCPPFPMVDRRTHAHAVTTAIPEISHVPHGRSLGT